VPSPDAPVEPASARPSRGRATAAKPRRLAPPILVRQVRNGVEESVHRGDIVEVDPTGRMLRALGDPDHPVNLRSAVKPFGLIALLEAGGEKEFGLESAELAIMAGSHSGEDLHVRTLQALFRRTRINQAALGLGPEGMPLDKLTAARLARDGERPSQLRHMCSGQHATFLLLCKLGGWSADSYWSEDHPSQVAFRDAVARSFRTPVSRLRTSTDGCGIPTWAFALKDVAQAYALLADPDGIPSDDPRTTLAQHFRTVRAAMLAHPEFVAGTRDRLDTSLMKAAPGRLLSKGGAEGLVCVGVLPGARGSGSARAAGGATGIAVKIEDGGTNERGPWAASVEALQQAGALDGQALRVLGRYHRPVNLDTHGTVVGEAIASFELAPLAELVR
jgi:L-asparaginase II